ncbi:MAG TPA: hypothetical protein VKA15_08070, partial [Isosphaeraceae bacterium]|nr:hypothetical protein [Isosphaeraceae bacterium]
WLRIIQTSPFLRKWFSLGLGEDDLLALEIEILRGPELYPIVKGTGGVRKVRFARSGAWRGKSRAYRVCYAYFARHGMVFLLTAYGKNEQANLTKAQQNAIARAIRDIEESIEKGEIR